MPREQDEETGRFVEGYPPEVFINALDELGGAASTTDVENKVGCSRRTTLDKLNTLADEGTIDRQKVGTSFLWTYADE